MTIMVRKSLLEMSLQTKTPKCMSQVKEDCLLSNELMGRKFICIQKLSKIILKYLISKLRGMIEEMLFMKKNYWKHRMRKGVFKQLTVFRILEIKNKDFIHSWGENLESKMIVSYLEFNIERYWDLKYIRETL